MELPTGFWTFSARDVLLSVGFLVTVVGWYVSNGQADKRENRKEVRAEIEACCKMADELLELSRKYYALDPLHVEAAPLAAKIRFNLQRLFVRIERLEAAHPEFDVKNAGGELMESITGDDFEGCNRKIALANSDLLMKIESDTHFLMDGLEVGFGKVFKRR